MQGIKLKKISNPDGTTDYKRCHYEIVSNELPKESNIVIGKNCMRLFEKLEKYKHLDRRYKKGFIWRLRSKGEINMEQGATGQ